MPPTALGKERLTPRPSGDPTSGQGSGLRSSALPGNLFSAEAEKHDEDGEGTQA